eukprot:CAMPEP_0170569522 /NCGR_PEP_ID=MMETSP0224-20130122/596_1 /TAXON_ID=285029 /ORGANISM="Togula jolla, Strain CCCM 725" /LENGTH=180 /DNA_ID=CAMNT_0010891687 /DNA_START=675 /DNA_END=1215 /DNA_ORIENTATION=-
MLSASFGFSDDGPLKESEGWRLAAALLPCLGTGLLHPHEALLLKVSNSSAQVVQQGPLFSSIRFLVVAKQTPCKWPLEVRRSAHEAQADSLQGCPSQPLAMKRGPQWSKPCHEERPRCRHVLVHALALAVQPLATRTACHLPKTDSIELLAADLERAEDHPPCRKVHTCSQRRSGAEAAK